MKNNQYIWSDTKEHIMDKTVTRVSFNQAKAARTKFGR